MTMISGKNTNTIVSTIEAADDTKFTLTADQIVSSDYSESRSLVNRIKTDERFAQRFFYGNSTIPGKSIAPIRSRIINQIRKTYYVKLNDNDVATIIYEHLFSFGTWKVLDSYDFRSTFFQWLSTVASHCIIKHLEDEGFIKINREKTPGNTRIVWRSKSPEACAMMLEDMINIPTIHSFLTALYVERKTKEEIQKEFNLDEIDYKLTLRASEKTLKVALLNSADNRYEDFIVEKNVSNVTVSSALIEVLENITDNKISDNALREVFGFKDDDPDFDIAVENFLYDFSDKLFVREEDRFVWQSRFIKELSPVEVAEKLHRPRPWVDTRYSRLNTRFDTAINEWWNKINL